MAQQFARFVNPVLNALKGLGGSGQPAEVRDAVVRNMGLDGSPLLEETLKSGGSRFKNQIDWARLYLADAKYIDRSTRGVWTLTEKGRDSAPLSEEGVNELVLEIQRKHKEPHDAKVPDAGVDQVDQVEDVIDTSEATPEESAYKVQLLAIIRGLSPKGFEQLCQRLLREYGFEQVVVTGRPRDGGIDGIGVLKVNAFVAFKLLFQCKRYVGAVSSTEVRNFHGAMQGRADKGIILTTGTFSADAMKEAVRDGVPPIELVDGERLVDLFEQLELGLVPRKTYDVDPQFFSQFDSDGDNSI